MCIYRSCFSYFSFQHPFPFSHAHLSLAYFNAFNFIPIFDGYNLFDNLVTNFFFSISCFCVYVLKFESIFLQICDTCTWDYFRVIRITQNWFPQTDPTGSTATDDRYPISHYVLPVFLFCLVFFYFLYSITYINFRKCFRKSLPNHLFYQFFFWKLYLFCLIFSSIFVSLCFRIKIDFITILHTLLYAICLSCYDRMGTSSKVLLTS